MGRRFLPSVLTFLLIMSNSFLFAATTERIVDLTAADGLKLKGTYFSAGKLGPAVLLLHQCNKDRKIWNGLARELANSGINVLTMDLRDFGDSEGKPNDKLTAQETQAAMQKWPSDIDKAYEYLVSQPDVKRDTIGVGGGSCGVANAVHTGMRHRVRSLVLLAGGTDMKGREFLRFNDLPILFGYADDDEFPASIKAIQWLYTLAPNAGDRLVRYDKGGHAAEIFDVHPEFMAVIVDWFVTTLIKTPGRAPAATRVAVAKGIENLHLLEQPNGVENVSKMLREARAKDSHAQLFPEDLVNIMGYEYMQAGGTNKAVEILKLNVEAYPNSANVYDSVSDAYLAAGEKDLARENAKKALEMLSTDSTLDEQRRAAIKDSAAQKLKQLGDMPQ